MAAPGHRSTRQGACAISTNPCSFLRSWARCCFLLRAPRQESPSGAGPRGGSGFALAFRHYQLSTAERDVVLLLQVALHRPPFRHRGPLKDCRVAGTCRDSAGSPPQLCRPSASPLSSSYSRGTWTTELHRSVSFFTYDDGFDAALAVRSGPDLRPVLFWGYGDALSDYNRNRQLGAAFLQDEATRAAVVLSGFREQQILARCFGRAGPGLVVSRTTAAFPRNSPGRASPPQRSPPSTSGSSREVPRVWNPLAEAVLQGDEVRADIS